MEILATATLVLILINCIIAGLLIDIDDEYSIKFKILKVINTIIGLACFISSVILLLTTILL